LFYFNDHCVEIQIIYRKIFLCISFFFRSALLYEMDRRHMQSRYIDTNEYNRYGPGLRIIDVTNDNLREVALSQHTETKV